MTPLELDQLVREIGDAVQRRMASAPAEHACACASPAQAGHGIGPGWAPPAHSIAALISQTLLRPDAGTGEVRQLCREVRGRRFGAVCVQPSYVVAAVRELRGSGVKVSAVIGYPHGATLTPVKLAEAAQVIKLGAAELELAIHVGALKSGELDTVYTEIRLAAEYAHKAGAALKVVAEMAALGESEKTTLCALARLAGADALKTSVDLPGSLASAADVALAHRVVGGELGIEAAGGVDTYARFREMMAAGATRVSTAAGAAILGGSASG